MSNKPLDIIGKFCDNPIVIDGQDNVSKRIFTFKREKLTIFSFINSKFKRKINRSLNLKLAQNIQPEKRKMNVLVIF